VQRAHGASHDAELALVEDVVAQDDDAVDDGRLRSERGGEKER
jgi:hypothetical protein